MTTTYTYTIFDADPSTSGPRAWNAHSDIEVEASSDDDAISQVRDILRRAGAGLDAADGYEAGQQIFALVWTSDGGVVEKLAYTLTADDVGSPGIYRIVRVGGAALPDTLYLGGGDSVDTTGYDTRLAAEAMLEELVSSGHFSEYELRVTGGDDEKAVR